MSLKASELPSIPEQTQRIAKAAFKRNNIYIKMRDTFETVLKDEEFADLFPRGHALMILLANSCGGQPPGF